MSGVDGADQINGGGLGLINPALYKIGADPTRYAKDFFDITTGNNTADPTVPGYPATTGWDPLTGLGTPNAANLVPDLVLAGSTGTGDIWPELGRQPSRRAPRTPAADTPSKWPGAATAWH